MAEPSCGTHALQVVVVSAMGSHPSSPVKVTDLLLNMVAKAARQDEAFLLDLAALQVSVQTSLPSVVHCHYSFDHAELRNLVALL